VNRWQVEGVPERSYASLTELVTRCPILKGHRPLGSLINATQ